MPNIILFKGKYTIPAVLITTLAVLAIFKFSSPLVGLIICLAYLLFFGYYLGQFFLINEKRFWQIVTGTLALIAILTIILTVIYWFGQINRSLLAIVMIILPLFISFQKYEEEDQTVENEIDLESYVYIKSHLGTKLLAGMALFLDILLFWYLWQKQSTDTLMSPWTLIGSHFYFTFVIATILIIWVLQKSKHTPSNLFLIIVHYGLILSVALIIFGLGYGFDPFIHQASEKWIANYGFLLPKQPYYLGQYLAVVSAYFISHLPIDIIDRIIVPIGTAILMPLFTYFAFSRKEWKEKIFPAILLIPIFPLIFFTTTSPNNLAQLLAYLIIMWIWYEKNNANWHTRLWGLIITLFICTIHPFIGLPILIIYFGSIFQHFNTSALQHLRTQLFNKIFYPLYFIILSLILPATFYLNSLRSGQTISLSNPLNNLNSYWSMFTRPFYYWMNSGNWAWKLLYYYHDALLWIIVGCIIFGIVISLKKYQEKQTYFFITTSLALLATTFILSTTLKYPDVIGYEQNVYAHRIWELCLIILIPYLVITFRELFLFVRRQPFKQLGMALVLSLVMLVSWYFTYPTRDPISHYTGYNIRQADIDAVNFINKRNNGNFDYIVLTNQAVATAALHEFGFAKYFNTTAGEQFLYSIPTGGPLYQYFRKMIYEEPKKQWMIEAMNFAHVEKAYFIHTNYWAPAAEIRDKAKLEADSWWEIDNGRVWVYEYKL